MIEGYTDTVPFGAYRREVFEHVGMFNERLARNQDNELCSRIIERKGKIYMTPALRAHYYSRATIREFLAQAFRTGAWNVLTIMINRHAFRWRHFVPLFFVGTLLTSSLLAVVYPRTSVAVLVLMAAYFGAAFICSLQRGLSKGLRGLVLLPLLFFGLHFAYGLGTCAGLLWVTFGGWRRRDFA